MADETIPDVNETGPWSNADVALHLGISPVYLSRMRNGYRHPSLKMMRRIHLKLGWKFPDQVRVAEKRDPLAYAEALQDFLEANFHVPRTTITLHMQPRALKGKKR